MFSPNYVSLALLRERWERKQIQTDNQYRERQRQTHHQERERAERDRKQHEQDQRDQNNPKQTHTRDVATPHPRNPRYQHHPKPEISQPEAAVLDDVAQKQRLKKKKKKKKSNWDRQKAKGNDPGAEGEGTGGTAEVEPDERTEGEGTGGTAEVEPDERAERVVTEKMRGIEGPRTKFLGKGVDQRGHRRVGKQKVSGDDTTSSIEQNFEALSVNGGKVGNVRSREGRNGNGRGFGRFDVRYEQPHRRRDDNFVWVKRGEGLMLVLMEFNVQVHSMWIRGTSGRSTLHSKELDSKREDWRED